VGGIQALFNPDGENEGWPDPLGWLRLLYYSNLCLSQQISYARLKKCARPFPLMKSKPGYKKILAGLPWHLWCHIPQMEDGIKT